MKAVFISIQPKWCELIASGKKTIEVRKTRPKLQTPFKCYIYETKGFSSYFVEEKNTRNKGCLSKTRVGGKVIGEFVCDRIEILKYNFDGFGEQWHEWNDEYVDYKDMCLSERELEDYLGARDGYAWHIFDLKIYDKPKELGEYRKACKFYSEDCTDCPHLDFDYYPETDEEEPFCTRRIIRPPQSWCYVEE